MEHYLVCPVFRRVVSARMGLPLRAAPFRSAMLLADARGHDEAALRSRWRQAAIAHFALHRTVNAAHHHPAWRAELMAERAPQQALFEGL